MRIPRAALRRVIRRALLSEAGRADHWALGLPGAAGRRPRRMEMTLYLTDGRKRAALERVMDSLGIDDRWYTSRAEHLRGETDPFFRRHAKATIDFTVTQEELTALEAALEAVGGWSWDR